MEIQQAWRVGDRYFDDEGDARAWMRENAARTALFQLLERNYMEDADVVYEVVDILIKNRGLVRDVLKTL